MELLALVKDGVPLLVLGCSYTSSASRSRSRRSLKTLPLSRKALPGRTPAMTALKATLTAQVIQSINELGTAKFNAITVADKVAYLTKV